MLLTGVKEMDGPDVSSSQKTYRDIHRLIVTMCCWHKLLNFASYMKETSLFWVIQTCHVFLLFGVEAGVILLYREIPNTHLGSSPATSGTGVSPFRVPGVTVQHPGQARTRARSALAC